MTTPYRLTPEQEANRIAKIKESLKGKPATEEQKAARIAGLRKAWREGRIKPSSTPESAAKTAAKLRGRKRPPEVVEKIRIAITGKKRTAEQKEAMRQRVIAGYAAGKYRPSTEGLQRRQAAALAAVKGKPKSEDQRRRHSEIMRGRKQDADLVEVRSQKMRHRPQVADATKKGPTHHSSLEGALRDSSGRVWWFRNVHHFVRTHEDLFDPKDLEPKPTGKGGRGVTCNAARGLLRLFGRGKVVPGTWKGWTVASSVTERVDGHADLIGRDHATTACL